MKYRLVVFDWEGTLSDTLGQVLNCVAVEARRLNFGELDENMARASVEFGLAKAVKKIFPLLTLSQHEHLLNAVQMSLMSRHSDAYLIPHAKDIVQRLNHKGVDLAIATNKGQQGLQRSMHLTGLDEFIKITRSAGQTPPKPNPQMLQEILQVFDVTVDDTLMVGDSLTDVEMATSIGMDVVGVNFYHHEPGLLLAAGAIREFDDYRLFADFLQL